MIFIEKKGTSYDLNYDRLMKNEKKRIEIMNTKIMRKYFRSKVIVKVALVSAEDAIFL